MTNYMFEHLKPHLNHRIVCTYYGDLDEPADICIECETCMQVLISAEDYDFMEEKNYEED